MGRIIVLGIGNRLMMDDGMGIYVVEELAKRTRAANIHYVIGETDIDYCLEQMEGAAFVIIVDAVYSGKEPGELSIYPLADLLERQTLHISPHNLHLFQVLYLQKDAIKGFLIGLEPREIKFQLGLSELIQERWQRIIEAVDGTIEKIAANIID
ncbi:MAG: hydrogenase maturation protease [Lysinibacillus sp.]